MRLADLPRNRVGVPVMPASQGYYHRPASRWTYCPVHHSQVYATLPGAEFAKEAEGSARVYRCRVSDGWHTGGHRRRLR